MARAVTVEGVRLERYEAFRKWAEGQPGYWILVRPTFGRSSGSRTVKP
jgi:hypothetical protein